MTNKRVRLRCNACQLTLAIHRVWERGGDRERGKKGGMSTGEYRVYALV